MKLWAKSIYFEKGKLVLGRITISARFRLGGDEATTPWQQSFNTQETAPLTVSQTNMNSSMVFIMFFYELKIYI